MDSEVESPDVISKRLVNNEAEYVALFKDFDLMDMEEFLNVEMAFEDGTYPDEDHDYGEEDRSISKTIYRKHDDSQFPTHYPCLVLLANDRGFDRCGDMRFTFLRHIYLSDFGL